MAFLQNVSLNLRGMSRDPHQMLIQEMNREDKEDAVKIDRIGGRPVDQRVGASDQYLILDSIDANAALSNPAEGVFVFNIQGGTGTAEEIIGVHDELHTISEIEFQSFPLPQIELCYYKNELNDYQIVPSPDIPVAGTCLDFTSFYDLYREGVKYKVLPALYCVDVCDPGTHLVPVQPLPEGRYEASANRFEIQISETSLQSFSDRCGFRHNFAFDIGNINGQPYASPVSPVFVFTDPINRIDSLSLTFFDGYRCNKLGFKPSYVCDVRAGYTLHCVNTTLPLEPEQSIYSLTFYIQTDVPLFKQGDKFYVSQYGTDGKLLDKTCMDPDLYNYIVGCGRRAASDYAMVVSNVTEVGDETMRIWGYEVNPFVSLPVTYNLTADKNGVSMNPIRATVKRTDAFAYGFTEFNSGLNIIALIEKTGDTDPYNIITCVKNKVSFLFRYDTGEKDKLLVNNCRPVLFIDLWDLIDPPPGYITTGHYYVKNLTTDIKTNVSGLYHAIMFTSAPAAFGQHVTNTNSSVAEFIRKTLFVPNIPPLCICIPSNQFRIPVRIRRILRRITQLSGL